MYSDANCFVCLKAGGNLNIFTTYNICNEKEELYVEVIKNCFNIEIALDSGPIAICNDCSIQLTRSYNFKNEIIQALHRLESMQVAPDATANENDKEYSLVEYLEDDYGIKTMLNPETGQISYTLDNIDQRKDKINDDACSINLDNAVVADKKVDKRKANRNKKNAKKNTDLKSEDVHTFDKPNVNEANLIVNKEEIKADKGKKVKKKAVKKKSEANNVQDPGAQLRAPGEISVNEISNENNETTYLTGEQLCAPGEISVNEISNENNETTYLTGEQLCAPGEISVNEISNAINQTTYLITWQDNGIVNTIQHNEGIKKIEREADKLICGFDTGQIPNSLDEINVNDQNVYLMNIGIVIDNCNDVNKVDTVQSVQRDDFVMNGAANDTPQIPDDPMLTLDEIDEKEMNEFDPNSFLILKKDVNKKEDESKEIVDQLYDTLVETESNKETPSENVEVKNKTVVKKKAKRPTVNQFTLEPGQTICEMCGINFDTTKTLSTHMNVHYPEFVCPICETEFASKRRLRMHERSHLRGPFECKFCKQEFTNPNTCNTHMWRVHSKTEPFKCAECGERFKTYLKRLRHLQIAHGQPADYACHYCDKKFAYAAYRAKHERMMHLNDRPHKCPNCESSFARRSGLNRHLASKHNIGEKKYECNVCAKKYYFRTELRWHQNTHKSSFPCTQCDQKFTTSIDLESHTRWHENAENVAMNLDFDPSLPLDEFTEDYALMEAPYLDLNEL